MLDVRKLQALQAVARHGSITAAARSLNFSAPAVSQQLAALEREADAVLFARTARSISLTDAGVLLAAHADIVLAQLDAATSALAAGRTPSGPLRIAAFTTAITSVLAPALRALGQVHPRVEASVIEAEPEAAERLLHAGRIDVSIVHSYDLVPRSVADAVASEPLFDEPMLVILAGGTIPVSVASQPDPIDLAQLRDRRWVVPTIGTTCHELVQRACGAAGFVPIVAAQCIDYASTVALVRAGVGSALVPAVALEERSLDGLDVRATQAPLHRYVSVQHRRGRETPTVRSFIDALHQATVHRGSRTPLVG